MQTPSFYWRNWAYAFVAWLLLGLACYGSFQLGVLIRGWF